MGVGVGVFLCIWPICIAGLPFGIFQYQNRVILVLESKVWYWKIPFGIETEFGIGRVKIWYWAMKIWYYEGKKDNFALN